MKLEEKRTLKDLSEDKWWKIWHAIWKLHIDASQACGYCLIHGYEAGKTRKDSKEPDCKKCEMFKNKVCVGPIPLDENLIHEDFLVIHFMNTVEDLKELAYKIIQEINKDKNHVAPEKKAKS